MATLHAYLAYSHLKPSDLIGKDQKALAEALSFTSIGDMDGEWVHVGTAEITVTLKSHDQIISEAVRSMRKKQGELQAECTRIDGQINSLLAIEGAATEVSA